MPLKTYETIGILNRHIYVQLDGIGHSISFKNGSTYPKVTQGKYTTSNPTIQHYLESNSDFNKKYRLINVHFYPGEKDLELAIPPDADDDKAKVLPLGYTPSAHDDLGMGVPEETDEDIAEEPPATSGGTIATTSTDVTVVESVINGQQARNYLIEHVKGLTFRQLQNNAQMIAEAKKHNIQFVNWEAFVTTK